MKLNLFIYTKKRVRKTNILIERKKERKRKKNISNNHEYLLLHRFIFLFFVNILQLEHLISKFFFAFDTILLVPFDKFPIVVVVGKY